MSENTERDTQFAGFARLLWDELPDVPEDHVELSVYDAWSDACEQIIARCAYDLAVYVIHMHTAIERPGMVFTPADILREIPDMIECPEETK